MKSNLQQLKSHIKKIFLNSIKTHFNEIKDRIEYILSFLQESNWFNTIRLTKRSKKNIKKMKLNQTCIARASISALNATKGGLPDPIKPTTPVTESGCLYLTPILSNSALTSLLVSNSSKPNSGFSCIFLLTPTIQSNSSSFLA